MAVVLAFACLLGGMAVAAVVAVVVLGQCRARDAAAQAEVVARAVAAVRAQGEASLQHTVETVLSLASDKLGAHMAVGTQQVELRNDAIAGQLQVMGAQLGRVNDLVTGLEKERAQQFGQLASSLAEQARQSAELAASTQSLRAALSNPKARGQWGERMAEDVLRLAGLAEGINYRKQTSTSAGTVPDFTFLLPGDWRVHMDVKFPIDNYLRFLSAEVEGERVARAAAFLKDVRARVKELGGRGYIEPGVTLGYVLLFIPNEAVYGFIHEHDVGLVDDALRQRVVLCSPFTLFAVLAVIRQAVEHFALERTSDEIVAVLRAFSTQWDRFSESMEGLGRKLETTQRAYEELSGPRRRQLQRTLDRVEVLSAQVGAVDEPELRAVVG